MNTWDFMKHFFMAIAVLALFHTIYQYWEKAQKQKASVMETDRQQTYHEIVKEIKGVLEQITDKKKEEEELLEYVNEIERNRCGGGGVGGVGNSPILPPMDAAAPSSPQLPPIFSPTPNP